MQSGGFLRVWVAGGLSLAREGVAWRQWGLRGWCPECRVEVALVTPKRCKPETA